MPGDRASSTLDCDGYRALFEQHFRAMVRLARLLGAERVDHLLTAVQRLPHRQRQVLILRYWLDLPIAEVAAALDMPSGTAKSLISRAQRGLATALEGLA
ncbi:RNA polymerase sigma factor [Kineococcus sp. SYSU DK003]|uniref:RNA polymerase sigma factor n=1 Tax=Kineococcus sp. SYSU DK003 TaxID=3383124 RepID=UPI003D7E70A0